MPTATELNINTTVDATDLANEIFGDGISITSATISGDAVQYGIYTGGETTSPGVVPSDGGVILSTGNVEDFTNSDGSADTNTDEGTTTNTDGGVDGDTQLDGIAGVATLDGVIFDAVFVPTGDFITMQFVFSSEEYLEFVNGGVNDAVGVWVNDTFVPLTPSGDTVSIDTVNDESNENLYVDNPDATDPFNTEMDGFTITMSMKAPVNSGQPNTIKIGLADGGDGAYDSNLLIAGDSIQTVALAFDDEVTLLPNDSRVVDVLANDVDQSGGGLTITEINGQAVSVGGSVILATGETVTLNADGTLTVQSDGDVTSSSLTYTVLDSAGNTDTGYLTINTANSVSPDGTVEGSAGDDVIDAAFTGDPNGDLQDSNDGLGAQGTVGNDDLIYAYAGNDQIVSGEGDDIVYAGAGNDTVLAGSDQDLVYGGDGTDSVSGGSDTDTIYGGAGDDTLDGGGSTDTIYGGAGDDTIIETGGSLSDDTIYGGDGNDSIDGGDREDLISGDAGLDTIEGGAGTDTILGGQGADSLSGGADADTIYGDGISITPADYASPGGGTATTLTVTNQADGPVELFWIDGTGALVSYGTIQPGDTSTQGTFDNHNWVLADENGQIVQLIEGAPDQTVVYGDENLDDSIDGGAGNDTIDGQFGDDSIVSGTGDDIVYGGDGNDGLNGGFGDDSLYGGDGNDTMTGGSDDDSLFGGQGSDQFNITDDHEGDVIVGGEDAGDTDTDTVSFSNFESTQGVTVTADGAESGTYDFDGTVGTGTFSEIEAVVGTAYDDTLDFTLDTSGMDLFGGAGDDSITGGSGNDAIFGGDGADNIEGGAGDDSIDAEDGVAANDTVSGGTGNDEIITDAGDDTIFGGADNDTVYAGTGDDTAFGGDGNDEVYGGDGTDFLVGGAGDDTLVGEGGDDVFDLSGGGTDTVTGGETGETEGDVLSTGSYTGDSTVDLTAGGTGADPESGTITTAGGTTTFSEIEIISTGIGNDSVIGSSGDDNVATGEGADTIDAGAGNDEIDLGGSFISVGTDVVYEGDGDADTIILQDGDGQDEINGFDAPIDNGDGTYTGIDQVDVSGLTDDLGNPVYTSDVTVTDDGAGNAVLSFPNGEQLTLFGVDPAYVDDPLVLNAMGIPLADGIVSGTAGNDTIDASYEGDPDGDLVDANDALLPGDSGNDDYINAGAGDDSVLAGVGNDEIYGGTGTDTIDAGTGDDIVDGADGNDTLYGGAGNDFLMGGTNGGEDALYGGDGDDTLWSGDGDDTVEGGTGDDNIDTAAGDDTIQLTSGFGNDDITAGETGETTGDTLDAQGVTEDVTLDLTALFAGDPESGTISDGTGTTSFVEVENFDLGSGNDSVIGSSGDDSVDAGLGADTIDGGAGNDTFDLGGFELFGSDAAQDTVVLQDGSGDDMLLNFEAPIDNGDGTYTPGDLLDVTALTDAGGDPVNTADVTVGNDGSGNAVLSFPNGESVTLIGVTPAEVDDPFALGAMGIPLPDGTVSGTAGNDTIGSGYTDADGDMVDGNDAILPGDTGNDDLIEAGAGDDSVYAGDGNDEVYAGDGNDMLQGGTGEDTVYGESGNDDIYSGSGDDTVYGGSGDDFVGTSIGSDEVYGGDGNDDLSAGGFAGAGDTLDGGAGNDTLTGGSGDDTLIGGTGDDLVETTGNGGTDIVTGGEDAGGGDIDTLALDEGVTGQGVTVVATGDEAGTYDFDGSTASGTFSEIEAIEGTGLDDSIDIGNDTVGMTVSGNAGNDVITGGSGDDYVTADEGDDSVDGGAGNDSIFGFEGSDTVEGGDGDDYINTRTSPGTGLPDEGYPDGLLPDDSDPTNDMDSVSGGAGNDEILTGDDNDIVYGGTGEDSIDAGFDDDLVFGGTGDDFISGNEGADTLSGDDGDDTIYGDDATGTYSLLDIPDDTDLQPDNQIDTIYGGAGNDTIFGMDDADSLYGGTGNDVIDGGIDNDALFGGEGADTLSGGDGDDTITFSEGDTASGGANDDLFILEDLGEPTNGTITIDGGSEDGADTLQLGSLGVLTQDVQDSFVDDGTGSFSGTITLDDGTLLNFSEIENIICFTPGTRIATPQGQRPIEDLRVGDMVVTRDHGLQPIRWIQSRTVPAVDRFAPVRIRPGVVTGLETDLLVSPQHRMLFQGYQAELLFGDSEVLVAATHLVDGLDVTTEVGGEVTYFHMMFDQHEIVYAEGAASESFHPGEIGLSAVSDPAREELFALFPELRSDPRHYGQTARKCLRKHEAQLIRF